MPIYAIGDVQGCLDPLQKLLKKINYQPSNDQLWFAGDIVNRGPQSLETLRFVKQLPTNTVVVLGNHDLHLLSCAEDPTQLSKSDTLTDILKAPDRDELLTWLRHRPFLHHAAGFTLVHAGLHPHWNLQLAQACAKEVETVLQSNDYREYLANMYGDKPRRWRETLEGWKRLRFITNCFTRLRFCDAEGKLDLKCKGEVGSQPAGYIPWFQVPNRANANLNILFGHWAALGSKIINEPNLFALDTGCVWGGCLTAFRLDDQKRFTVECKK